MNEQLEKDTTTAIEQEQQPKVQSEHTKVIEVNTSTSLFRYFLGAMIIFGVCFVSCLFIFQVVFTQIGIIGYSMQPTLNASATGKDGDKNTDIVYFYNSHSYEYKDIVIIKEGRSYANGTPTEDKLVKRVIATPGQKLSIKKIRTENISGQEYFIIEFAINDKVLVEDYIKEQKVFIPNTLLDVTINPYYSFYNKLITTLRSRNEYSFVLEKDEYFVMGDNRNHSTDSRNFGPVKKSEILGKVVLQIKYGKNLFHAIWSAIFGNYIIKYI